jgi:hypothetical protein
MSGQVPAARRLLEARPVSFKYPVPPAIPGESFFVASWNDGQKGMVVAEKYILM